ncbi:hypothetical protein K6119_10770 [Paracrocinitomix mangrovi]|uniref:hypothetical protein n=1 Tax=Paracrocinitomix mangrovi TaxID=2862509 RepID=UPI001C8E6655|nr:hypothetical protein [Paracrocinitomix mangrovi]UKN00215.1 hypothetical protein K6119_10770 [Paracrocinitomix mangrovi]
MPKTLLPLIGLFTLGITSCKNDSSEENIDDNPIVDNCYNSPDSLIRYGMEPLSKNTTEVGLIDIRTCWKLIENDSLKLKLELRELPDSVLLNNQNIPFGYFEYGLEFVFRNQSDTSVTDNIVFALHYMRSESDSLEKLVSLEEYLSACAQEVYHEQTEPGESFWEREMDYIKIKPTIQLDTNMIQLCYSIDSLCKYIDNYFTGSYAMMTSYNASNVSGTNNFLTDVLTSDGSIKHNFLYNSSRSIPEN